MSIGDDSILGLGIGIGIGIDIGGSSVKIVAPNTNDSTSSSGGPWQVAQSSHYSNPDRTQLAAAMKDGLSKLNITTPQRIGLCLPGRMNSAKSAIERSTNLPALNGWAFPDLLRSVFEQPVPKFRVVSDADAAGYDYATAHPIQGRTAALSLGTGIGLCVLDNDTIVTMGQSGIGHIGDMDIGRFGDTDRINHTGIRNTPESYFGAPALSQYANGSILDLTSLASDDSPIQALVQTLRIIHAIYLPNRIALLGGVGLAFKPHRQLIHELVNDQLTTLADQSWTLDFATTSHHAAQGAAKLANQDF